MSKGTTILAKIGKKKDIQFINLTYEEIKTLYEQRSNRRYDSTGAFKKENLGGLSCVL